MLAGLGVNSLSMTPVALDDVRASLAEVTFEEAQAVPKPPSTATSTTRPTEPY